MQRQCSAEPHIRQLLCLNRPQVQILSPPTFSFPELREAGAMIAAGTTLGQVVQALEISEQTLHRCGRSVQLAFVDE
jgi:hypothetical protein